MKVILSLATAAMVLGTCGVAFAGSATQEAMDEEVATKQGVVQSAPRSKSDWYVMPLHRDRYGWRDLLSLHSDLGVKTQQPVLFSADSRL